MAARKKKTRNKVKQKRLNRSSINRISSLVLINWWEWQQAQLTAQISQIRAEKHQGNWWTKLWQRSQDRARKWWQANEQYTQKKKVELTPEEKKRIKQRKLVLRLDRRRQKPSLMTDLVFWSMLFVITVISVSAIGGVLYIWQSVLPVLPPITDLAVDKQRATTKIYDRNHRLLYNVYEDENRTPIAFKDMGEWLPKATVAIEDRDFWEHQGFSIPGMARAVRNNYQTGKVQGGSTITQQLVKNRLLNREKTLDRKIKEFILAIQVEQGYTKEQILEMYLNDASYGGTVYGAEQASVVYFGKNAKNLTLGEAAYLAGMTRAPSNYIPTSSNLRSGLERREEVFRRMLEDGMVTAEQVAMARQEELKISDYTVTLEAPHFVMYIKDLLEKEMGIDVVRGGGLEIVTTLDLDLQREVEEILVKEIDELRNLRISNGAVLVTNPQTGEVLTMLGSQNYWATPETTGQDGQMNVTTAQRQPGSSIKPLVYALALMNGKTPNSIVEDNGFEYRDPWSGQVYRPQNYDGRMHGPVTLREALASSYNIPAVKLLQEVGVGEMIDLAEKMGISTWTQRGRYGLSLALGAGEVKMTELATAYGVFPNLGDRVDLNPILEIRNSQGEITYRNRCALDGVRNACAGEKSVLPAGIAYQLTDILKDNQARTPGFGAYSVLNFPDQEVAVKTGTTNSLRDNWTVGYITNRLVSVWVGNNDNTPMSYVASGITGASPIWQETMKVILAQEQLENEQAQENLAWWSKRDESEAGDQMATPSALLAGAEMRNTNADMTSTRHEFEVPINEVELVEYCAGGGQKCGTMNCPTGKVEYYVKGYQQAPSCESWGGGRRPTYPTGGGQIASG